jgi:hypothetical protein
MRQARSRYDLRSFVRIWCIAVVGVVFGFVLALAARANVGGPLATIGAVIAAVSVFGGFVAFIAYVIIAAPKAFGRHRPVDDDRDV